MPSLTCTPKATIAANSCLACMSKHELLALAVLIGADTLGTYTLPTDTNALLKDSVGFKTLSDKQLLQSIVAIMAADVEASATTTAMRARIKCLVCADPKALKAAFVFLWCRLWAGIP